MNVTKRLAVLAVFASTLSLHASAKPHKRETREQILAIEGQWRTAQLAADTTAMDKLLAPDYLGILWNGDVITKTQQLDRMRSRQIVLSSLETSDVNVKIKGSVAIVTSLAHVQASSENHPIDGDYRYTRVYQRQVSGHWQITNFEMTRVRSAQDRHNISAAPGGK